MFSWAAQPDIVRSLQKDTYYIAAFREECRELAIGILGSRAALYDSEVEFLSSLIYYGTTTLTNQSTLGEEYCDIKQVTIGKDVPGLLRRAVLIASHVVAPFLFKKFRRHARSVSEHGSNFVTSYFRRCYNAIIEYSSQTGSSLSYLERVHLGLFYMFGYYLEVSKRVSGVRYLLLRQHDYPQPGYQLLGVLLFTQLGVAALRFLREKWEAARLARQSEEKVSDDRNEAGEAEAETTTTTTAAEGDDAPDCQLCLMPRSHPTATECGHLFCWDCICQSLDVKPECPLCRQPCIPSNLLLLSHYR